MSRKIIATTGVAALVLTLGWFAGPQLTALSFTLTGVSHAGPTASYGFNPNFTDSEAGSSADQISAIRNGADEWRVNGGANFEFLYNGTTTTAARGRDFENAVFYAGGDGNGALAVCWYWSNGNSEIVEFDIEFYDTDNSGPTPYDFVWSFDPQPGQNTHFDIRSVACHEFGHALGLNHSADNGAVMFPSVAPVSTANRTIEADDIAGMQSIYGPAAALTPTINSVSPSSAWIDGGATMTLQGRSFSRGVTAVSIGGVPATNIQIVDLDTITCRIPAGNSAGPHDVVVTVGNISGTLQDAFTYDTLRTTAPAALDRWMWHDYRDPSQAGKWHFGALSLGNAGIPLGSGDRRVVPLSYDALCDVTLFYPSATPEVLGLHGSVDANGESIFRYWVTSNLPQLRGYTVHACLMTYDPTAPSQIGSVSNAVSLTFP